MTVLLFIGVVAGFFLGAAVKEMACKREIARYKAAVDRLTKMTQKKGG